MIAFLPDIKANRGPYAMTKRHVTLSDVGPDKRYGLFRLVREQLMIASCKIQYLASTQHETFTSERRRRERLSLIR